MKKFNKCPVCKEYHWLNRPCDPIYTVFDNGEYLGEYGKEIRGDSHEDAAIKFAAYYNTSTDYALMGDEMEIEVEKDGERKKFIISAEPSVDYSAKEIK